jgi:UDP-2,3-diacylglucosamine pyrophosphatase LpxH
MTLTDFTQAEHTLILSDIHLANAESVHPVNPLWKRFKLPEHFIDQEFKAFLKEMTERTSSSSPIELILNGDIFDFDSVMSLPPPHSTLYKRMHISVLERLRGLSSEEEKSRFKIGAILDDHPIWLEVLREFVMKGNRLIFVIGNHDMELHWPAVQQDIVSRLNLSHENRGRVRFCEWFYISNQDTLVEHGNQYDSYCLCSNPIHPLIHHGVLPIGSLGKGGKVLVRLPFGNLAGKYMINGMGFMNPHASGSFIKESALEYLQFYYRYVMKTQPFLLWTWFWSAFVTLVCSLRDGFLPALRDPLTIDARIEEIAKRANASVFMVLSLKEVHVHPAIFNPIKILRELWLDRALLLGLILVGSFQFFSVLKVFANVSIWWFVIPLTLLLPCFIFYARSVQSEVGAMQDAANYLAPLSAKIAKVKRVIHGHTHQELHQWNQDLEFLNTGTWSPAFHDVECTQPFGRKCFAWIRPAEMGSKSPGRVAFLYEWKKGEAILIPSLGGLIESHAQQAQANNSSSAASQIKEPAEVDAS